MEPHGTCTHTSHTSTCQHPVASVRAGTGRPRSPGSLLPPAGYRLVLSEMELPVRFLFLHEAWWHGGVRHRCPQHPSVHPVTQGTPARAPGCPGDSCPLVLTSSSLPTRIRCPSTKEKLETSHTGASGAGASGIDDTPWVLAGGAEQGVRGRPGAHHAPITHGWRGSARVRVAVAMPPWVW